MIKAYEVYWRKREGYSRILEVEFLRETKHFYINDAGRRVSKRSYTDNNYFSTLDEAVSYLVEKLRSDIAKDRSMVENIQQRIQECQAELAEVKARYHIK